MIGEINSIAMRFSIVKVWLQKKQPPYAKFITIRKGAGLTQTDLAAMLGLSRVQVSKYENSRARIPMLVERFMRGLEQNGEKYGRDR